MVESTPCLSFPRFGENQAPRRNKKSARRQSCFRMIGCRPRFFWIPASPLPDDPPFDSCQTTSNHRLGRLHFLRTVETRCSSCTFLRHETYLFRTSESQLCP